MQALLAKETGSSDTHRREGISLHWVALQQVLEYRRCRRALSALYILRSGSSPPVLATNTHTSRTHTPCDSKSECRHRPTSTCSLSFMYVCPWMMHDVMCVLWRPRARERERGRDNNDCCTLGVCAPPLKECSWCTSNHITAGLRAREEIRCVCV